MGLDGLNRAMFRAGERICCAVSGGADSVALLLALREANEGRESLGVVLTAVHVHHGLRALEADEDERFVRDMCARLDVPLRMERVDTPGRQAAEREGVEEAARALRYRLFEQVMASGAADAIATGHTLDDQAETVVLKLLRGAWTEGLGGISPVREVPAAVPGGPLASGRGGATGAGQATGRILRPLLNVRRREVEAFLRARDQSWREDSSNRDLALTRNRVRHELMPVLRSFNPAIDELLGRTSAIARDEEVYWRAEIDRILPGLVLPGKPVRGGGRAVSTAVGERALAFEIERLRVLPAAARRRIVREGAVMLGCRIGSEETAKLLALAGLEPMPGMTGRVGARLELAGGLRAERSARELRLSRLET